VQRASTYSSNLPAFPVRCTARQERAPPRRMCFFTFSARSSTQWCGLFPLADLLPRDSLIQRENVQRESPNREKLQGLLSRMAKPLLGTALTDNFASHGHAHANRTMQAPAPLTLPARGPSTQVRGCVSIALNVIFVVLVAVRIAFFDLIQYHAKQILALEFRRGSLHNLGVR